MRTGGLILVLELEIEGKGQGTLLCLRFPSGAVF